MPHDVKGRPLTPGDVVILKCEVDNVNSAETGCNVAVRVIRPAGFEEPYLPVITLNSKLVEKVDDTPQAV